MSKWSTLLCLGLSLGVVAPVYADGEDDEKKAEKQVCPMACMWSLCSCAVF